MTIPVMFDEDALNKQVFNIYQRGYSQIIKHINAAVNEALYEHRAKIREGHPIRVDCPFTIAFEGTVGKDSGLVCNVLLGTQRARVKIGEAPPVEVGDKGKIITLPGIK